MSTIKSSTTTTTAYSVTADTTGTLVFQTGATPTTAMTLGSDQSVTFAGAQTYTGASTFTSGITVQGLTVGRGAGAVATNTAVGASALAANTTGARSVAFGYNALAANTTGYENSAFGHNALTGNTTGIENTAIGREVLTANTTGNYNTSVGEATLNSNTTGSSNTAVGQRALLNNTTASNNTAVGYQAGYTNVTNTAGTFLGYQAGYLATGDNNTFVGLQSGYRATGGTNTFVGFGSGGAVTSGAKNTILGAYSGNGGGLDIRTLSNNIVLSDGDGNPRISYITARNSMALRTGTQGIARIESATEDAITVASGGSIILLNSFGEAGGVLISVYDNNSGYGAVFFAAYIGTVTLVASDGSGLWAATNTAGKYCVFKSGSSHTVNFGNNSGASPQFSILIMGAQAAYG